MVHLEEEVNEEIMACLESLDAIVMEHHDGKFSIYVDGHSIDQMTADELADPKNKARLVMSAEFLVNGGE